MSLTIEQLKQVAHLARLEMTPDQADHYTQQLSSILDLVDQLQQAKTDQVEPMAHPLEMSQRLRPDTVTETNQRDVFQSVAPSVEDGLYVVPKVIE
ncbi:MAG: Asp-tRNA(Asn)/Glu-tRNA(Gln) amidotransferase subunit GatC [Nevskiales bacterium]|nr:Asp-tRNA(Asn)/Glu-tRNA(Gln) amidotransferase subunit GatC [Nevskiales bacterium]